MYLGYEDIKYKQKLREKWQDKPKEVVTDENKTAEPKKEKPER